MHSNTEPKSPRELVPPWNVPATPPTPPPVPANGNLQRVLLLNSGALLLMFDREVIVDPVNPPTTWSFHGVTSIQSGSLNFGTSSYIILDGVVNSGDPVHIAAGDPGARTADGGYVNSAVLVVSDL